MSRLEYQILDDFTGGLNSRRNDFNLAPNESPDILNIEIDPRGGFFTRRGWQRWNTQSNVGNWQDWEPRNAEIHELSDGSVNVYISSNNTVWLGTESALFTDLSIPATAIPHLADFAPWGDTMYIACGRSQAAQKVVNDTPSPLTPAGSSPLFNDDYTTPVGGVFPNCDLIAAHSGYIFCAGVYDVDPGDIASYKPNRLRWSHPQRPEDWAYLDYIDVDAGGGKITAIMSFRDHLLIFKTDSVWALYGYDLDSFQLIQVSGSIGVPHPGATARSESAAYFFSGNSRGGIYAYVGESPIHLTERLRPVMEGVTNINDIWMAWINRRLWVTLPYDENAEPGVFSTYVFDPEIGQIGAWTRHQAALGNLTVIIPRSDIRFDDPLGCITGIFGETPIVRLGEQERAVDVLFRDGTQTPYKNHYSTGWLYAGWPERRKSWRRPRMVMQSVDESVNVVMDTYWDYKDDSPRRTYVLEVNNEGSLFWRAFGASDPAGDGWDWGDGSTWGSSAQFGAAVERVPRGLGVKKSIQLVFYSQSSTPGAPWGIDSITLKFLFRMATT